jgi:PIN domain nuclease of toxin-antitoxin system
LNFLIDTHCWLWWLSEPERLNARARRWIAGRRNAIFFSAASAWEIAIKAALGKLRLPEPAETYVPSRVTSQGMVPLPVNQRHALHLETMPLHHRDPFDRMLIAQAQVETLAILTADPKFLPYEVEVLWASRRRLPRPRPKTTRLRRP